MFRLYPKSKVLRKAGRQRGLWGPGPGLGARRTAAAASRSSPTCPALPGSEGRGSAGSGRGRSGALSGGRRSRFAAPRLPHLPEPGCQRRPGPGSPASPEGGRPPAGRGGCAEAEGRATPAAAPRRARSRAGPKRGPASRARSHRPARGPLPAPRPARTGLQLRAPCYLPESGGEAAEGLGSGAPLRPWLTPATLASPVRRWPLHPDSSGVWSLRHHRDGSGNRTECQPVALRRRH